MTMLSSPRAILPVLYVGHELTEGDHALLRAQRIGVLVADTAARARRMLMQFRVAAVVFAVPDLPGLASLRASGVPLILLAARDAACNLDGVTILRRHAGIEDIAAVIHGLVRRQPAPAALDAA